MNQEDGFNFQNENVSQQNFNKKTPKKLILIIFIVIIIIGIAIVSIVLTQNLLNNDYGTTDNDAKSSNSIKNGNVKLLMTSTKKISCYQNELETSRSRTYSSSLDYGNYPYFSTRNDEGELIIIDNKGKQILPVNNMKVYGKEDSWYVAEQDSTYLKYLGDGYFIYNTLDDNGNTNAVVVKDGKLVVLLDQYCERSYSYILASKCEYKDGILYLTNPNYNEITAYALINKKELWKINGRFSYGCPLDDGFLRTTTDPRTAPDTILDKNGNKIVSGRDIDESEYSHKILTSEANIYLDVNLYEYIKIYDLNNNLKATIPLEDTENTWYSVTELLNSGSFILKKQDRTSYENTYTLYNQNGEVLLTNIESMDNESCTYLNRDKYMLDKSLDLIYTRSKSAKNPTYYLIKDGKIIKTFPNCYMSTPNTHNSYLRDNYLRYGEKLVNLNTLEETDIPPRSEIWDQCKNGKYVILKSDKYENDVMSNYWYVYDNELNLKYEAKVESVRSINENYILTYEGNEINLVNVETGTATKLDVKGSFYSANAWGLVTKDETNYYLYLFN